MTTEYEIASKIGHCTRWLAKTHGSKFTFCVPSWISVRTEYAPENKFEIFYWMARHRICDVTILATEFSYKNVIM